MMYYYMETIKNGKKAKIEFFNTSLEVMENRADMMLDSDGYDHITVFDENDTKCYEAQKMPMTLEKIEDQMGIDDLIIKFNGLIILARYDYYESSLYYAEIYKYKTSDHSCEGAIERVAISDELFEDSGNAIAWALYEIENHNGKFE